MNFGIIIYTPCDRGSTNSESSPLKGKLEKPNDISGIVYIPMESNNWKIELGSELLA